MNSVPKTKWFIELFCCTNFNLKNRDLSGKETTDNRHYLDILSLCMHAVLCIPLSLLSSSPLLYCEPFRHCFVIEVLLMSSVQMPVILEISALINSFFRPS